MAARSPNPAVTAVLAKLAEAVLSSEASQATAASRAIRDAASSSSSMATTQQIAEAGCVDALITAAHGNAEGGGLGLERTLLCAIAGKLPEHTLAAIDALAACATSPIVRGAIAGSGILGMISAVVLSPNSPPGDRAVGIRAAASMAFDDDDVAAAAGEERAREFQQLRQQLLSTNVCGVVARHVGEMWDGSAALLMSDDDDDDDDDDLERLLAAAQAEVAQDTLIRAACEAVRIFSRDPSFVEKMVEEKAASRLLRRLPCPHAARALKALAAESPACSDEVLSTAAIRITQAIQHGDSTSRRECVATLASALASATSTGSDTTRRDAAREAADAAMQDGLAQSLRRAVVLGGDDTAKEVSRLVEVLSLAGGNQVARELSAAGVDTAIAQALAG